MKSQFRTRRWPLKTFWTGAFLSGRRHFTEKGSQKKQKRAPCFLEALAVTAAKVPCEQRTVTKLHRAQSSRDMLLGHAPTQPLGVG